MKLMLSIFLVGILSGSSAMACLGEPTQITRGVTAQNGLISVDNTKAKGTVYVEAIDIVRDRGGVFSVTYEIRNGSFHAAVKVTTNYHGNGVYSRGGCGDAEITLINK